MKRILAFLLALTALAACSKEPQPVATTDTSGQYRGTVSVDYEDTVYDNENILVSLKEEEGGLTLMIYDIKFVPQMPLTVTVTIKGIPFYRYGDRLEFSGDNIVPYSGILPFKSRTVYGLEGVARDKELTFSLRFGDSPTRFHGSLAE